MQNSEVVNSLHKRGWQLKLALRSKYQIYMLRNHEQRGQRRFAVIGGIAIALLVAWVVLSSPGVKLLDERFARGTVVEIVKREHQRGSTAPDLKGLAIAVVELPDGGKARVFARRSKISLGGEIRLKVKNYSDGTRKVIAAGEPKND